MSTAFFILTILFIIVSAAMVLIILVQRPQGGGLAGAFGGAGGGGTDTVFGGRVGDALTWATVGAFAIYLVLAVSLNLIDSNERLAPGPPPAAVGTTPDDGTGDTFTPSAPAGDSGGPSGDRSDDRSGGDPGSGGG